MATIIRAADTCQHGPHIAEFNFDDIVGQASRHLDEVRAEAASMIAQAKNEADTIRRQAAEAGCQAAVQEVEGMVATQLEPALAALRQAGDDLRQTKQTWISQWEAGAVHLAAAIAARIVRHELSRQPEIAIALVREALELAAGSPNVRLHLNPEDYDSLGDQVQTLVDTMSSLGDVEVMSDTAISRGGCRVETRFGTIDQQIESQLKRIEEELTQ